MRVKENAEAASRPFCAAPEPGSCSTEECIPLEMTSEPWQQDGMTSFSPEEIEGRRFSTTLLGFSKREVESFLQALATERRAGEIRAIAAASSRAPAGSGWRGVDRATEATMDRLVERWTLLDQALECQRLATVVARTVDRSHPIYLETERVLGHLQSVLLRVATMEAAAPPDDDQLVEAPATPNGLHRVRLAGENA